MPAPERGPCLHMFLLVAGLSLVLAFAFESMRPGHYERLLLFGWSSEARFAGFWSRPLWLGSDLMDALVAPVLLPVTEVLSAVFRGRADSLPFENRAAAVDAGNRAPAGGRPRRWPLRPGPAPGPEQGFELGSRTFPIPAAFCRRRRRGALAVCAGDLEFNGGPVRRLVAGVFHPPVDSHIQEKTLGGNPVSTPPNSTAAALNQADSPPPPAPAASAESPPEKKGVEPTDRRRIRSSHPGCLHHCGESTWRGPGFSHRSRLVSDQDRHRAGGGRARRHPGLQPVDAL